MRRAAAAGRGGGNGEGVLSPGRGFGVRGGSSVLAGAAEGRGGEGSGAPVSCVAASSGGGGAGLAEGRRAPCSPRACRLCLTGGCSVGLMGVNPSFGLAPAVKQLREPTL